MKQNRYPVLFLTQGITTQYPTYADPRCHTIENAVNHSVSHNFLVNYKLYYLLFKIHFYFIHTKL